MPSHIQTIIPNIVHSAVCKGLEKDVDGNAKKGNKKREKERLLRKFWRTEKEKCINKVWNFAETFL